MYLHGRGRMCEKKRIVLRYLWTFLVCMDKITCKADLERHHTQVSWKESFKGCGSFGGASLFQNCQAKTCNASVAKGRIGGLVGGLVGGYTQEYWINGYVQRSPVLTYEGCFWVQNVSNQNFKDVDAHPKESLKLMEDCFSHSNSEYIYLQKISNASSIYARIRCLVKMSLLGEQVSANNCEKKCGVEFLMMCGGHCEGDCAFVSVYHIQRLQISTPLGKTCYMSKVINGNRNAIPEFCSETLKSACESFNRASNRSSYFIENNIKTWHEAQMTCFKDNQHLVHTIDIDQMKSNTEYWIGHFVVEFVTWKKEDVPENAKCLKLVLRKNTGDDIVYYLETGDCNDRLYPLCVSGGSTANNNPQNNFSTIIYAIWSSTATDESVKIIKSTENAIHPTARTVDQVGAVIGGVIGCVLVVGLVVAVIYKRNRQIKTESSVEASNVQMEMPQRNERSVSRLLSDPNTTEEGVYNHLGDGESAQNVSNGIYDMSGRAENEYDVGTLSAKHGGDSDLYDRAATSGDEYSTLNNKNRPSWKHADTNNEYDF